jgi:TRAP-type mannitol/chloroaromatic compound transport system substrate-binding protein
MIGHACRNPAESGFSEVSFNQASAIGGGSRSDDQGRCPSVKDRHNKEGKRMKRREFLKVGGVGLAASTVAAPAIAQSMPEIKWRLTASWPKSLDTLYGGCEYFCKRVAEITDNKFQIQPFAAGEIVPGLQVLDAVSNGTVEMGNTALYYYWGKNPAYTFGTSLPFGLNTRQHISWLLWGGGQDLINDLLRENNVYGIPTGSTGAQMGGWYRKEVKSMEDLKGLKFRVGGFAGTIIAKVGGVPQQLAAGDIYPALEKGTIDAAEWVGPYDDEKLGFVKVAKYYYYPGWWEGGTALHFFINSDKWDALPKAYKALLTIACGYANLDVQARYDARNPQAIKRLVANGALLRPFSQAIMEACLKASNEVNAETSAVNPDFKKILDSQMAFRDDGNLWWQVAEYSYETFMIRTRPRG